MFIEDAIYKDILKNIVVETVDVLVINRIWQVLLWLRNNQPLQNIYYIPWWRREKNEKLLDAVKRKMIEELWIDIDLKKLIFLWIYDDIFENSMFEDVSSHYSPITYVYHLDESEQNNIRIDAQHSDLKFFNLNDPTLHPMVKIRILDMNKLSIL
jgi:colanic acid biosynthesis protein WcaH